MPEISWHGLVRFDWVDSGLSYRKGLENAQVTVKNTKGNATQLKLFQLHKAKHMLVVFLDIDDNSTIYISTHEKYSRVVVRKGKSGAFDKMRRMGILQFYGDEDV